MENGEYKRTGYIMTIHYINNNIQTSYLTYLCVYQDEYENLELYQEINIFGLEPKPK